MIEQRVTLRYGAQQIPAIVQAVQGDTGRDVIFELADYEIPAGATANYYIDKPDDTAIYNSAEVISSTEIRAHLTEQALAVPGRNNGQVRILADDEVITSFDFVLEVEAFRGLMRMQSETEVNIFDEALQAAAEDAIEEIQAQTPVVTGMQNSIAPTYSSSSTYAVGDYVMYNAQLYRCVTAITTAEAWTAAHWTQVPLANDVNDLKSAFVPSRNIYTTEGEEVGIINSYGTVVSFSAYPNLKTSGFIHVEENKRYTLFNYDDDVVYSPYVVGFYTQDKTFIKRILSNSDITNNFTTPENTAYVRMTESLTMPFPVKLMFSETILPYSGGNDLFISEKSDLTDRFIKLACETGNIGTIIDGIKIPFIINSVNVYTYSRFVSFSDMYAGDHILLEVHEGDIIELYAKNNNTIYALLKDDKCYLNERPSFVDQYDMIQDEYGTITFEPIIDEHGDHVEDNRHSLLKDKKVSFIAVPESAYLYITNTVYADNGIANVLPYITINGVQYNKQPEELNAKNNDIVDMVTVFYDDFETFNSEVWQRITQAPPVDGFYNSRFFTDENNAYVDQSCLVLKCAKGDSDNNGTHLDIDGVQHNNEYLAPYISTGQSIAIQNGRISAKIKLSNNMVRNAFPWAFWTFGQSEEWSYACEVDIIEGIQFLLTEPRIAHEKVYNRGSVVSTVSSHMHTRDLSGEDVNTIRYLEIAYANLLNGAYENDDILYNVEDFDPSQWHIYTMEYSAEQVAVYVDNEIFCVFDADKIGAVDRQGNIGFSYPQDIRFNIKALATTENDGYMFVDWVKVEVPNAVPPLSISHTDISLSVGDIKYINPTFNDNCSNKAFSMVSSDPNVAEVIEIAVITANVQHIIKGKSSGTATITMTSANGITTGTFEVNVS